MFTENKYSVARVLLIIILFILQFFWLLSTFTSIINITPVIRLLVEVMSVLVVLFLVIKDENPAYKMSWIILILLVPIFGALAYALIGNKRPTRWMRRKLVYQELHNAPGLEEVPDALPMLERIDPRLAGLSKYVTNVSLMPVYTNSDVNYYPVGEAMMEDLIRDLNAAEKFIFIEFFIVEPGEMFDQIFEVLVRKAREGLDVRFLYDDFGTFMRLPKDFIDQLEHYGIKGVKFNPLRPVLSVVYNTRDHRKFIIIDGKVGYTGGVNIADEYINRIERFGYWKDNMIRVQGPAVWSMTNLFLNMWNTYYPIDADYSEFCDDALIREMAETLGQAEDDFNAGFVQTFGDSPLDNEQIGESVYREILAKATDYVYIYTPYLVISFELQTAIERAAKRGVDVVLITPGIPDKKIVFQITRSYYRSLLEAGVRVYEYTPGFMHCKTFVSDDTVAAVGTINLDYRSLYLHFESSTLLYYHQEIAKITEDFERTMLLSREVTLQDVQVGFLGTVRNALLRLAAPFV